MTKFGWSLADQQDVPAICWCGRCGGEIYSAADGFLVGRWVLCRDCMRELLRVWLALYAPQSRGGCLS